MSLTATPDTRPTARDDDAPAPGTPAPDDVPGRAAPATGASGAGGEAVEVRTDGDGHLAQPAQLLWQGRLFLVRHALRLAGGLPAPGDQHPTGERWRLLVGDGPAGRTVSVVVVRRAGGGWTLHRDAA